MLLIMVQQYLFVISEFTWNHCFLGSAQCVSNIYGIGVDLSWFNIVSSIFSVVAILFGSRWTVQPIQEETNALVSLIVFIPLFFYRMVAWMVIITLLHSFSLVVFVGFALINIAVFFFLQDKIEIEPLVHSFLSIIFPVSCLPTSDLNKNKSFKLLFWLVLIGNLALFGALTTLCLLYNYDVYNPWCPVL